MPDELGEAKQGLALQGSKHPDVWLKPTLTENQSMQLS